MSTSNGAIQRIQAQYATWEHALFWLGLVVNFFVFYLLISVLPYVGWYFPVFQGLYLSVCFMAYAKGFKALHIIVPLFLVSGALYMSLSPVI